MARTRQTIVHDGVRESTARFVQTHCVRGQLPLTLCLDALQIEGLAPQNIFGNTREHLGTRG